MGEDVKDAEHFDEDHRGNGQRRGPADRTAVALGGMALFIGVLADTGARFIRDTERNGPDANPLEAVDGALQGRGDAADEIRAGLHCFLEYAIEGVVSQITEDEGDEPEDRPRPSKPRPKAKPKPKARK